jgi:phospholipase/carboxylesterase
MRKMRLGRLDAHVFGGTDGLGGGDGPLVVLMHGFGAPGTDLVAIGREVRSAPGTRWVFPMAPNVLEPGISDDVVPRAWWLIDMLALQVAVMTRSYETLANRLPEGIGEARAHIDEFLAAVQTDFQVGIEQIVLGGFSQGAMLATDTALRQSQRFAGLAIFSGSVIGRPEWQARAAAQAGLPTLLSHGRGDPILPFALAEELRDLLRGAGLEVNWVPFPGGHGIPAEAIQGFEALLAKASGR